MTCSISTTTQLPKFTRHDSVLEMKYSILRVEMVELHFGGKALELVSVCAIWYISRPGPGPKERQQLMHYCVLQAGLQDELILRVPDQRGDELDLAVIVDERER